MGKDSFLNKEKIENCIKELKEKVDIPEDFYIYPFFMKNKTDEPCFINIKGEETLDIYFSKSEYTYTETIENIKKYKRIYLLIPHRIKILHYGGKTFMDVTPKENLKDIGYSFCKLFKEINSTKIYVCHIRSDMSCNELIEFVKVKLKEYEEGNKGKLIFVVAESESKNYEFKKINEGVYLIFPDYSGNFIKEIVKFLKERNITSVEVISHGREGIKKALEAESINVEFYDITSTVKELYQRYRKLEEVYENSEEFLRTLSEIKDFFRKTISTPLILKKLAHRLSGQVANLSITLELYRVGKESSSDVVNTLEHIRNTLFFAKDELKRIKTSSGGEGYSDKIKEIERELNSVEEKITFDWEKILEETISDLRKIVKSIKNLMEEEGKNENTVNR